MFWGDVLEGPEDTTAPPRPRGRTALLWGTAALLGLAAGTCGGYLVQADREPTELPPLSQPVLPQAKGPGPEPLSAAQDRRVRTDGDLRELLLPKPAGAEEAEWLRGTDGWLDAAGYADGYYDEGEVFRELVSDEYRRAAVVGWESGALHGVEIRLVQFRQVHSLAAADSSRNYQEWAAEEETDSWSIPGTGNGMAYVHNRPDTEPGYEPVYRAEAHAWRGDIAMEIWIHDNEPISKETVLDVAERQMERL